MYGDMPLCVCAWEGQGASLQGRTSFVCVWECKCVSVSEGRRWCDVYRVRGKGRVWRCVFRGACQDIRSLHWCATASNSSSVCVCMCVCVSVHICMCVLQRKAHTRAWG